MSSRRLLTAYWVWMGLLLAAYYALPQFNVLWGVIGLSSTAAIVTGIIINRPSRRLPWYLVALAMLLFTAGDSAYLFLTDVLNETNPFPSVGDLLYLAMYPVLIAGVLLLPRLSTGRDRAGAIDVLVVTTSLGLLFWIFLISPYLENETLTTTQRLTSIAYPLFDVLFIAVAARLVTVVGRNRSVMLMAVGGFALLVTDVLYGFAQLNSNWRMGGAVDLGWFVFYSTWGAAALHPSMTSLTEPRVAREAEITPRRLAIVTGSALIPPVVLLIEGLRGNVQDAVAIAVLCAVVFLLVLLRLGGVMRRYRLATQRERSLREAGAALVSASDVKTVQAAVAHAIAQLFPSSGSYAMAMPLKGATPNDEIFREPGPTRFVRTEALPSGQLDHLGTFENALVSPLVVSSRRSGSPHIGTLAVASDEQRLADLQGSLEVLAAEAALAIERISLNAEVGRRDSEQYFRTLVQNATDVIMIINDDGTIRYASPSASTLFAGEDVLGRHVSELVAASEQPLAGEALGRIWAGEDPPGFGLWSTRRPDGSVLEVHVSFRDLRDEPTVGGIVLTLRDVTEQRRLDRDLNNLAFYDALTGLPNRVRFADQVNRAMQASTEREGIVGVLFVDVDDFKMVNDTMGHEIGDQLLEVVGQRLSSVVRGGDMAARLGGDEFAVLVEDAADPSDVERVADQIISALAEPVVLRGNMVSASASIGVATTMDLTSNGDLLREADLALYVAKGEGKGRWRRYQPRLHTEMVKAMDLRSALDRAVANGEFALMYQPIVRLADETPVGMEALLRWDHPQRGLIGPGEFIDAAEESGLIVPIGDWALKQAMTDAAAWADAGAGSPQYLSVNISVRQFHNPGLIDTIEQELRDSGLAPERLLLEITESLLLRDDERVWSDLTRLRDLGIRVAIDDFGTGYSSLSYLRQMAIDVIKIDRSFTDTMGTSEQQRALVETIVRLAQILGLDVVAEGVASAEDRELLVELGCPYGQGFLFARPMSPEETSQWLASHQVARQYSR